MKKLVTFLTILCLSLSAGAVSAWGGNDDSVLIRLTENVDVFQFVGQFNNSGPNSQQFGYISRIEGLDSVFSSDTLHDETTAEFTFVTNATNVQVVINGPFKIVNRTGTTTIYLNNGPSSFANPASFSQGTPIQVSEYRQQVILNTATGAFTTVHFNTVTDSEPFHLNGIGYQLGRRENTFRTIYSGVSNAPGSAPGGWFAGYAVGVK